MKTLLFFILLVNFPAVTAETCAPPKWEEAFSLKNAVKIIPKQRRYTQGLVFRRGYLYESSGIYGRSALYRIDPESGDSKLLHKLPDDMFAEGLAYLGGLFYQLTWKAQTAFVHREESILGPESAPPANISYSGEGWGLAAFGDSLLKSDGTDAIEVLDSQELKVKSTIRVKVGSTPLRNLNELEMVGDELLANLYTGQTIVAIDPKNGCVKRVFDLTELYRHAFPDCEPCGDLASDTVANGIAYDPLEGKIYLTGKAWPFIFVFQ